MLNGEYDLEYDGTNWTVLNYPYATATIAGAVELATTAETTTGTDSSRAVTPAGMQASKIILGTEVSATGTSIDFTGIPSWAKEVTIEFSGVSTNGTSIPQVQIGDSGGIETSGYNSGGAYCPNASAIAATAVTSGFMIYSTAAANVFFGSMTLRLKNATTNEWSEAHAVSFNNTSASAFGGGAKALSPGPLDRVRITTVSGTDSFDAGTINVTWR